jgi:hypothetical protein
MSTESPNVFLAAWSMLRAQRVRRPDPHGFMTVDHVVLLHVLEALRSGGMPALADQRTRLGDYRASMETIDPDRLSRDEALAFWLNLYNAGALDLAAVTAAGSEPSVLRVPGAFQRTWATVAGENLSLDDIEHGKIRRFRDPRIHGALVCGSASCPTLRHEPFRGRDLDEQLEDQMKSFLAGGGATYDPETQRLRLSRIFLWYGADFSRPQQMPAWVPARRKAIARAVSHWLDVEDRSAIADATVEFNSYDWGLACRIG